MTISEPSPRPHGVRVYILRLRYEPDGRMHGHLTDPVSMRRWTFEEFEGLRKILEEIEGRQQPPGTP
ncbi:hypothetical protein [Thermoflexus sp.]|uniref:hypothetical protein n=1 Tax=Thermoflexus sp. TaxID=1969742 RepID=UPI0025E9B325|nr:hypothetical protein [Thermoflexus sp.]MCS6964573.1 hypothetical protein [Thermoflexus sp.]MCX7691079.1 hypothetical protein [Thermoflexus sp.]MDW8186251.1 hypothetical protein [Anaerolineae bacterium]